MNILWIKALHLISMVAWFAGLFYLPRLFVYHAQAEDAISQERFKIMERKLYYGIITPASIATLVFGIWLLIDYAWTQFGHTFWLQAKLILVILLLGYQHYCARLVKAFAKDNNQHSHVFYRWVNEIPTLFLILIVILATVKPTF